MTVSDSEPRYQLLDSNGNKVGSLYINADGDVAIQEGTNQNELTLASDGTVGVPALDTDRINSELYVKANEDPQTIYDNAGIDDHIVIGEDNFLDSTFVMNRSGGPTVEARGTLVPNGDFSSLQITEASALMGYPGIPFVSDYNSLTTAGTPGIEVNSRLETLGTIEAQRFGGPGVYFNQTGTKNLNGTQATISPALNGGDGIKIENTSGNPVDLNGFLLRTPNVFDNGGRGINILDGVNGFLQFGKITQNTGAGIYHRGGWTAMIGGETENNGSSVDIGNSSLGLLVGRFDEGRPSRDTTASRTLIIDTNTPGVLLPTYTDATRPTPEGGKLILNRDDNTINVGLGGVWYDGAGNTT